MDYNERINQYCALIENNLVAYIDEINEKSMVSDAMKYSLMNGGKRIRPVLALAFCEMLGGNAEDVIPAACALEMIHTYSLIHDDLPCMDNDDMRRGKPSCHKQFGEEYALLAGDALLNKAFEIIFGIDDPALAVKFGRSLSKASGIEGMIGGQTIDLISEGKKITIDELKKLHSLKTGALINTACEIGVIAAGGTDLDFKNAKSFSSSIGLAFQIVDDILDIIGDEKALGKPIGSDEENEKSTYVTLLGLEKAKKEVAALTENAINTIKASYDNEFADFLIQLAENLSNRNH